jgi:hypothetical protein
VGALTNCIAQVSLPSPILFPILSHHHLPLLAMAAAQLATLPVDTVTMAARGGAASTARHTGGGAVDGTLWHR